MEVAGLILAVIPIVTQLSSRWKIATRRAEFLLDFKDEIKKFHQDVGYHECTFKRNLRRLLGPVFNDYGNQDKMIQKLLEDPHDPNWADESINIQLQKRLQDSYQPYMDTLTRYHTLLHDLKDHLGMNVSAIEEIVPISASASSKSSTTTQGTQGTGSRSSIPIWIRAKQTAEVTTFRARFATRERQRKELVKNLEMCNSRLTKLLDDCDKEIEQCKQFSKTRFDKARCEAWKGAKILFDAIRMAWRCNCWENHKAAMLLSYQGEDSFLSHQEVQFHIMFMAGTPTPWSVLYTRIVETIKERDRSSTPQGNNEFTNRNYFISSHARSNVGAKTVRFHDSERQPSGIAVPAQKQKQPEIQAIRSLCASFIGWPFQSCYGYLRTDYGQKQRYYVYPAANQPAISFTGTSMITLEHLIQSQPRLRLRERLSLATRIASAFIQLAESPWLPRDWKKEDIVFYADPENPGAYQLNKPHIGRDFAERSAGQNDSIASVTLQNSMDTLGVILWELGYGMPVDLSQWIKLGNLENDRSLRVKLEFLAAREKVSHLVEVVGPRYTDAVAWCFQADVAIATTSQDKWRNLALQNIIGRLDECLSGLGVFFGPSTNNN